MNPSATYLVLGSSGLLGQELLRGLAEYGSRYRIVAPGRQDVDLSDATQLARVLEDCRPDVVINSAAWTDVDGAERERDAVFRANTYPVGQLADYALNNKKKLVQVSTASVFSGRNDEVFAHGDVHSPLNVYNTSKAEAEKICFAAAGEGADISVFRTYWLYGRSQRGSFVNFAANQALGSQKTRVVSDQYGQPTLASDLAKQIIKSLASEVSRPIFHSVNSGNGISRLELTYAIFEYFKKDLSLISPVEARDFGAQAPRPEACNLDLSEEGLFLLRPWKDALYAYLNGLQQMN